MEFTLGRKRIVVTREAIERILENLSPEPLGGRMKYYVEHKGRRYPIKQVVAAATALPKVSFTTMHAYKILTELGFEVKELERG